MKKSYFHYEKVLFHYEKVLFRPLQPACRKQISGGTNTYKHNTNNFMKGITFVDKICFSKFSVFFLRKKDF